MAVVRRIGALHRRAGSSRSSPCCPSVWLAVVRTIALPVRVPSVLSEGPLLVWIDDQSDRESNDALIRGAVQLSGSGQCATLESQGREYLVVWPRGTSWNGGDQKISVPDGGMVEAGDVVSGGGGDFSVTDAEQVLGRSVADAVSSCASAAIEEIAAFNTESGIRVQP